MSEQIGHEKGPSTSSLNVLGSLLRPHELIVIYVEDTHGQKHGEELIFTDAK